MSPLATIRNWLRPAPEQLVARRLFDAVMSEARRPEYYMTGGVADTVDGRFDLVVLHLFLVMRRLKSEGAEGRDLGQRLFDIAFANFDEALREMGVGDLSVPKKVRKMAEAFYGRVDAYQKAFDGGDAALDEALRRNLYRINPVGEGSVAWARAQIVTFERRLAASTRAVLLTGNVAALEPAA